MPSCRDVWWNYANYLHFVGYRGAFFELKCRTHQNIPAICFTRWWKIIALVKNHAVLLLSFFCFALFCFFFVSFYFIKALQSENSSNVVYVLGCKNDLDLLIAHFNPYLAAWARNWVKTKAKTHVHWKIKYIFFSMSLLHCQSSYYTDFHTVAGLITTRYSTLSKLSMRLIDQIQPTLYFSVNNEEASRFSKGSRVTHVTVCCIPSRKIVFH